MNPRSLNYESGALPLRHAAEIDSEIIELDYFQFPKFGFETLVGLGKQAVAVKS